MRTSTIVLGIGLALCASTAKAQTRIPDHPAPAPGDGISWAMQDYWSGTFADGALVGGTAFGQTFTVPADPHLDFLAESVLGGLFDHFDFRWYLAGWEYLDATHGQTTGVLWASGATNAETVYPDLYLSPGQVYAFFLAPESSADPRFTGTAQGLFSDNWDSTYQGRPYSGGGMITLDYSVPTDLGHAVWNVDMTHKDLNFLGQFSPVPEPATLTLIGLGLAGLGAARRRLRGTRS